MHFWHSPFVNWHNEFPDNHTMYVCKLRASRNKARVAAVVELLSLLSICEPLALLSGPLAEERGIVWIAVRSSCESIAEQQFHHLGYIESVQKLIDANRINTEILFVGPSLSKVRWHGKDCLLTTIYQEDKSWMRERAPDRRTFLLRKTDGELVAVKGYRGDSTDLGRRGLPPEDARLLVNLALIQQPDNIRRYLLDPFAGTGGIIIEALGRRYEIISGDIDPALQFGLKHLGATHCVLDATYLPFANNSFDAISTELPFHEQTQLLVSHLMGEFDRTLKLGGRLALMGAEWQTDILKEAAERHNLTILLESKIDRKGLDVNTCLWRK